MTHATGRRPPASVYDVSSALPAVQVRFVYCEYEKLMVSGSHLKWFAEFSPELPDQQ